MPGTPHAELGQDTHRGYVPGLDSATLFSCSYGSGLWRWADPLEAVTTILALAAAPDAPYSPVTCRSVGYPLLPSLLPLAQH